MINIVLFGAPGCGKGTQAQRLKEHYGIEHVSTGEVIRGEIARGTELGRSMESYIKAGKLAPDQIVIDMIANYVAEHRDAKGCIFDGFPRTTVQAEEFDKILAKNGLKVDIMIDIRRKLSSVGTASCFVPSSPTTSFFSSAKRFVVSSAFKPNFSKPDNKFMSIPPKSQTASYAVGSLNELFSDTMRLNTSCSGVESFASTQKNPWRTNWKLS